MYQRENELKQEWVVCNEVCISLDVSKMTSVYWDLGTVLLKYLSEKQSYSIVMDIISSENSDSIQMCYKRCSMQWDRLNWGI